VIDRFIGCREGSHVLPLHAPNGRPYILGIFLLGAYQEILGDLHNLFGDTNAVHVDIDEDGSPLLQDVVEHDTVAEVLGYVGFDRRTLLSRMRRAVEKALQGGRLGLRESRLFLHDYERGLAGTTYLEDEEEELPPTEVASPSVVPEVEVRAERSLTRPAG